jgi:hypothetical protein
MRMPFNRRDTSNPVHEVRGGRAWTQVFFQSLWREQGSSHLLLAYEQLQQSGFQSLRREQGYFHACMAACVV